MLVLRFANAIFEPLLNRQLRRPRADHRGRDGRHGRPARARTTSRPGRCATWCRTTCCSCWRWWRWTCPLRLTADDIRDEKVKVLRRHPAADARSRWPRRPCAGSTPPAGADDRPATARRRASPPTRQAETFVALQAVHRQLALGGRAVLPAHGQAAGRARSAEIVVVFQPRADAACSRGRQCDAARPQPPGHPHPARRGHRLIVDAKVPGPDMMLRPVKMDFRYELELRVGQPRGVRAPAAGRDAGRADAVHPRRRGGGRLAVHRPDPPGLGDDGPAAAVQYPPLQLGARTQARQLLGDPYQTGTSKRTCFMRELDESRTSDHVTNQHVRADRA